MKKIQTTRGALFKLSKVLDATKEAAMSFSIRNKQIVEEFIKGDRELVSAKQAVIEAEKKDELIKLRDELLEKKSEIFTQRWAQIIDNFIMQDDEVKAMISESVEIELHTEKLEKFEAFHEKDKNKEIVPYAEYLFSLGLLE